MEWKKEIVSPSPEDRKERGGWSRLGFPQAYYASSGRKGEEAG